VTDATITARASGGSVSLGISGRALAPAQLLVEPARLEFGDVFVAGAAVLDLAISNVGDEPLPALTSSVRGEAASDFHVSENRCSEPLRTRETCSISVSFSPGGTGPHAGVLSLDAGGAGSVGVDLSGAGLPAGNLLVAAAEGGDFGPVVLGSESQRTLHISNTSNEASGPITLAVNSADFSVEPPGGSECFSGVTNLAGGASCDVRVRFAPTQRSPRNATLTVSSRLGGTDLNLSGVGLAPADIRADGAVDFGSVSQGGTATRSVMVANAGDQPLTSLAAGVSGLDAASFSVLSNGCMQGLAAQGSCVISMAFAPTTTGSELATLTLEGEPGGTRDVTLSGTAVSTALLGVQPSALVFDAPAIVGQIMSAGLIVTNRGDTETARVTASIATDTSSFSIEPGTCRAALAAGASCQLSVDFVPTAAGLHSGSLRVTSTPAGMLEVPVSGTGILGAANAASNLFVVATQSTYFGSVGVGASASLSFTLRNTGVLSAGTLTGITIPGTTTFGTSFSVAPRVGAECQPEITPLNGGASCDFRILFRPTTTGTSGASVTVSSSIGGTTLLSVSGDGY
jgi:Abnormal spindle-like microcephaly-assoc'd, ASPM-SPD-2-Hydin